MSDPAPVAEATERLPEAFGAYRVVAPLDPPPTPGVVRALAVAPDGDGLVAVTWMDGGTPDAWLDDLKASTLVTHDGFVPVLDVGRAGGRTFVVTPFVEAVRVDRVLEAVRSGARQVPPGFAAWIGLELCRALEHAHTRVGDDGTPRGLVLRGLPPQRVWVGVDGRVRLEAWGVLAAHDKLGVGRLLPGALTSPELTHAGSVDRRSDVWAVAALVRALLTGVVPAAGRAREEDTRDVSVPHAGAGGVPRALDAVLAAALLAEPEERFPSARELGEALRATGLAGTHPTALRAAVSGWVADSLGDAPVKRQVAVEACTGRWAAEAQAAADAQRGEARRLLTRARWGPAVPWVLLGGVALAGASQIPSRVEAPPASTLPSGALVVQVSPPASVIVDGAAQGRGAEVRVERLEAGPHRLRLEADGHEPWTGDAQIVHGGTTRVSATLEPVETIAPVVLVIDSRPRGAEVRVDGVRVGETPARVTLRGSQRRAQVTIDKPGFAAEVRTLTGLRPGERRSVDVTLAPP